MEKKTVHTWHNTTATEQKEKKDTESIRQLNFEPVIFRSPYLLFATHQTSAVREWKTFKQTLGSQYF